MTHLKELPVNLLKLDMSFVRGITSDNYDRAIADSIIRLGNALNLDVIAEGIESSDIVEKLLDLGCHRGQGYLISPPVAANELTSLLKRGSVSTSVLHQTKVEPLELADLL
jgi:EAL domain-containing protein (putative c-di-GMP-specific phosphodiesterase class I)